VAPETKVLTDNGHQKIADICGKSVRVWNGEEWSEVDVFKTGTNQELMEVRTSDGGEIVCTPYHKFFIQYS
jgi:ribonucleoside-diphosphate reductase alpha chain